MDSMNRVAHSAGAGSRRGRVVALASLAVIAWAAASGATNAGGALARTLGEVRVGDRVPDLELPRIDGTGSMRLSELRGTKLLLIEFASW